MTIWSRFLRRGSVFLVCGPVVAAFADFGLIAIGNRLYNPASQILGRGIEVENFVKHLVVDFVDYKMFYFREVNDHAVLIEFLRAAFDNDFPVVSVYLCTRAVIIQLELVGGAEFEFFSYVVHYVRISGIELVRIPKLRFRIDGQLHKVMIVCGKCKVLMLPEMVCKMNVYLHTDNRAAGTLSGAWLL